MAARFISEDTPDVPSGNYDRYIEDQIAYFKDLDHRDEGLCVVISDQLVAVEIYMINHVWSTGVFA